MAFGMQKVVYEIRPRKSFSKRRKTSFAAVSKYKRNFKLQPSKSNGSYNFGILFFLVLVIITSVAIPNWLTQARTHNEEVLALVAYEDNRAFEFLMKSGKKRLIVENHEGAYSEFKLAQAIKPDNSEINQLLFETLSILCIKENKYCVELDDLTL